MGTDLRPECPELERPPLRKIDTYCRLGCPCYVSKRYIQAVLVMFGFIVSFGIRCNVGVAMVSFLSAENGNDLGLSEFNWTPETIGYVDASFSWGYIVTQLPGGFLASRFPANKIFGLAIFLSSSLNLLLPTATQLTPRAVIAIRFMQGLAEGVTIPSCQGIWRWWAPPLERSIIATLALAGSYSGALLGMQISGLLSQVIGWYAPYYVYGCFGIIWYMFWLWLSFEKPAKHPDISPREQLYIEKSLGDSKDKPPTIMTTPWVKMLTSLPVWAIIIANFARSWTFYLLLIALPVYFREVFGIYPRELGTLEESLPHLIMTLVVPFGGQLADYLRRNEILGTTNVRKIFNCGGFVGMALFLFILGMTQDWLTAVFAVNLAVCCSGFAISGFNVNHLDIAPRYASILMGISNGVGTLAAFICPITVQHILVKHDSMEDFTAGWQIVFLKASSMHLFGALFYACFASGEVQDWAKAPQTEEILEMDVEETLININVTLQETLRSPAQSTNSFTAGQTNNPFRRK